MATYNWYRVHHGMVSDPKWPLIARNSGQNVGTVVAVWCSLLDYASQNEDRGSVRGFCPEEIDALYGYDEGTVSSVMQAMEQRGMIVDDVVVSWEKRQASKTSTGANGGPMSSTERSRLYRERKKLQRDMADGNAATPCNASATDCNALQRDATQAQREGNVATPCNAIDKIREDKRREEISLPLTPSLQPDALHGNAGVSAPSAPMSARAIPEPPAYLDEVPDEDPDLRPAMPIVEAEAMEAPVMPVPETTGDNWGQTLGTSRDNCLTQVGTGGDSHRVQVGTQPGTAGDTTGDNRGQAPGTTGDSAQGQPQPTAHLSPENAPKAQEASKKPRRTRGAKADAVPLRPEDFEAWYGKYPRKEARQPAISAWNNAVRANILPGLPVLLEALDWQIPAHGWGPTVRGQKNYTPLPASYLNARRWLDQRPQEPSVTSAQGSTMRPGRPMTLEDKREISRGVCKELFAEFMGKQGAQQASQTTVNCTALPGPGRIESLGATR